MFELTDNQIDSLDRLNRIIIGFVLATSILMLYIASKVSLFGVFCVAIVYSIVLTTNYALMHEATHNVLQSNPKANWFFGMLTSWLFPMSFTLFKITHDVHHCCNRTDHEMFDCYYTGDNLIIKNIQWYGLMLGLWWPLIPIGTVLMALFPWIYHTFPFKRARSASVLFDDFTKTDIWKIRLELLGGISFWSLIIIGFNLKLSHLLIIYLCWGFSWSTRQYVTHAFTERDVRNGALNLKVSRFFGFVLLNGQWDLVHHRHPKIPWYFLPKNSENNSPKIPYWKQYLRLWKGPVHTNEIGPKPLAREIYSTF